MPLQKVVCTNIWLLCAMLVAWTHPASDLMGPLKQYKLEWCRIIKRKIYMSHGSVKVWDNWLRPPLGVDSKSMLKCCRLRVCKTRVVMEISKWILVQSVSAFHMNIVPLTWEWLHWDNPWLGTRIPTYQFTCFSLGTTDLQIICSS